MHRLENDHTPLRTLFNPKVEDKLRSYLKEKETALLPKHELSARNFTAGTFRITEPGIYTLTEDIRYEPSTDDLFPDGDNQDYKDVAYRLGFFAGITIECSDVIIDLNGYSIGQTEKFALLQRFHAVIELADQPFIMGQGPADFGRQMRCASRVWIKNGTIARSSHHGIHGNGARDILMTDLQFRDYEVASISLSGCKRVAAADIELLGTSTKVPVRGAFSAAVFNMQAVKHLQAHDLATSELTEAASALQSLMDETVDLVLQEKLQEVDPLFRNPTGLIDGNTYGIAIHSRGVLVNAFQSPSHCKGACFDTAPEAKRLESCDISLRNVEIDRTQGSVTEVIAVCDSEMKPLTDVAGSVIQFFANEDDPQEIACSQIDGSARTGNLLPKLNPLARLQFELARIKHANPDSPGVQRGLSRINIPMEVCEWAEGKTPAILKGGKVTINAPAEALQLRLAGNGDSMFHVNKGNIGLFAQTTTGLTMENVHVRSTLNTGEPGSDLPGSYSGPRYAVLDGAHPLQGSAFGYTGADTRGIYLGACAKVTMEGVHVNDTHASIGSVAGIELSQGTYAHLNDVTVASVSVTIKRISKEGPNAPTNMVGLMIGADCSGSASKVTISQSRTPGVNLRNESINFSVTS